MTDGTKLLAHALHFAAERHTDQRRKGAKAEPYLNHLVEVLHLVAHGEGGDDPILLVAAVLHDTVEDTHTTLDEITAGFGAEVAVVVTEVTDDKSKEKDERKRLQVETVASKSVRAKRIRLADKTSNLRALLASPPADWDLQRKRDYFAWAARVVAGCRGVDAILEAAFDEAYAAGLRALGKPSRPSEGSARFPTPSAAPSPARRRMGADRPSRPRRDGPRHQPSRRGCRSPSRQPQSPLNRGPVPWWSRTQIERSPEETAPVRTFVRPQIQPITFQPPLDRCCRPTPACSR